MTVLERERLSPRGPGIHRTAKCKVYGSIHNITRLSTPHMWLARSTNSRSLSSRRARFARRPRSTETHVRANRSIVPCASRGLRQTTCAKHAHPMRTAQMRAADRWSTFWREARPCRCVTKSLLRSRHMRAAALLDHRTQPGDGLHRATALRLPTYLAER